MHLLVSLYDVAPTARTLPFPKIKDKKKAITNYNSLLADAESKFSSWL